MELLRAYDDYPDGKLDVHEFGKLVRDLGAVPPPPPGGGARAVAAAYPPGGAGGAPRRRSIAARGLGERRGRRAATGCSRRAC